jgi:2-keto-4-pentenoate hydratase/2-oxohepta-3-ene-1,7-dioic acid hydratase in catechol pathway
MPIPSEPIIFLKPPTAALSHKGKIVYPPGVKRLDYEAELAFVIKKKAKNIPQKDVSKYILGYTCLNDVTARDLQKKDVQWTRAKSFDSFCPVGPWIETDLNPDNLKITCCLNRALKQRSSTSNFIFSVPYLVSFISKVMTLCPGDIISTGTPPGVGPMQKGDRVAVEIEGIGCLENIVD